MKKLILNGNVAAPNGQSSGFGVGVVIANGASGNTVGGTSAGARNVISGNLNWAVCSARSAART